MVSLKEWQKTLQRGLKMQNNSFKFRLDEIKFDVSNLKVKDNLHPDFWVKYGLKKIVRQRLLEIAQNLLKHLDYGAKIEDIKLTGSIASFNWHELSDIDLHIVVDFKLIDENVDLVRDFLNTKRLQWNKRHNITIFNHEVEIYFEDLDDEHQSTGIFSILHNEWLKKPRKETVDIDYEGSVTKAEFIANEIDLVYKLFSHEDYDNAYHLARRIKEKIKKLRQSGLRRDGVYSVENLAFKLLRNSDYLQKLSILKDLSYDKMLSIDKNNLISVNLAEKGPNLPNLAPAAPQMAENLVKKWKNFLNVQI